MNWYKIATSSPIVSFDFDDTIYKLSWDNEENDFARNEQGIPAGSLNMAIKNLMSRYSNEGAKVIIVSSRMDSTKHEIEEFVAIHNLPVSEIYCTNGQYKLNTLKNLHVSKHYDDDKVEIDLINSDSQIKGILV